VCDTEPIAIEGLRSLLESAEGLCVVAAESSITDGRDAVRELQPSVLIVDKGFGIQPVAEWVAELWAGGGKPHVIVWGSPLNDAESLRFLQAGARGVVRKTASLDSILNCLRSVTSGSTFMDEDMIKDQERPVRGVHSPLTMREMQVMELVERGMKNKDIAVALGIRTGTVKIHLKHIF